MTDQTKHLPTSEVVYYVKFTKLKETRKYLVNALNTTRFVSINMS